MSNLRLNHFLGGATLLLATALASSAGGAQTIPPPSPNSVNDALAAGFTSPPPSAGIRCFWWWLNGNVTKAGITHDLEQMKAKGYSGALIVDAGGAAQDGNRQVPAGPMFGSPAWRELFKHAVAEASRLGLELSLNIQSGWNLGGPNVSAEESSKILTWSEQDVNAGAATTKLETPASTDGFYRDIAVLAWPLKATAANTSAVASASSAQAGYAAQNALDKKTETFWVSGGTKAGEGPTPQRPEWLQISFSQMVTVGALKIRGRPGYSPKSGEIQVSSDGNTFRTLRPFTLAGSDETVLKFEATTGSTFRLLVTDAFDPTYATAPRNVQIVEVALLAPDGSAIGGGQARPPVQSLRAKAVFTELGGSATDTRFLLKDEPGRAGEEDTRFSDIVSLTGKLQKDGTLDWAPPAGGAPQWHVMRFGYTYSGAKVSTASGDWQGRVIDPLNAAMMRLYWKRNVDPLLADVAPQVGKTLKYVDTDSWELGGANWTEGFAAEFQGRRGYDPVPYLPIVAGKIINDRDTGTRFLADLRKTIGDCVADNHYGVMAELARARGMGTHPESAGPHAGPFDGIKDYGRGDLMLSEFWVPSPHRPTPESRYFVKQASSAAHIYNKNLVGAEAFTSIGPHWNDTLWSAQKPSFDHELCAGLNIIFHHTFTSSPPEMGLPGQEYFAGTHFNPQVTWWDMAGGFISYLKRCQYLMQQGYVVTDALYYYGDHVPNIAAYKQSDPAHVLPGYDYDVLDEEVLLQRLEVKDGFLTLGYGPLYRVLVLPDHKVLSLAALRKIETLVRAGATIVGPKTERTVSLVGYPQSEVELSKLTGQLWGAATTAQGQHSWGKGRVFWGRTAREVLLGDGIAPDFEAQGAPAAAAYDSIHRKIGAADLYFISNQSAQPLAMQGVFRIGGRQPELWDAVTGEHRLASAFHQEKGRTTVPLELGPYGSLFVVFRQPIAATAQGGAQTKQRPVSTVTAVNGPWDVSFDAKWGAPASVRFDRLESWTARPETGIKFYSGTGVYHASFELPAASAGQHLFLELGDVRDIGIARVRVNGRECGITWTPPFRVDISGAAQVGTNKLEVEVPNSWRNRLVGDRDLPPEKRLTQTNITTRRDWQVVDSGLLGPVRIVRQ